LWVGRSALRMAERWAGLKLKDDDTDLKRWQVKSHT
jgi:hypothetical protein